MDHYNTNKVTISSQTKTFLQNSVSDIHKMPKHTYAQKMRVLLLVTRVWRNYFSIFKNSDYGLNGLDSEMDCWLGSYW